MTGDACLPPPPDSWAAQADADVAILTLKMAPGAGWTLPPARSAQTRRQLYFFSGTTLTIAGQKVVPGHAVEVAGDAAIELQNADQEAELLLLQGRPIGEPVAQYGPFVMNT